MEAGMIWGRARRSRQPHPSGDTASHHASRRCVAFGGNSKCWIFGRKCSWENAPRRMSSMRRIRVGHRHAGFHSGRIGQQPPTSARPSAEGSFCSFIVWGAGLAHVRRGELRLEEYSTPARCVVVHIGHVLEAQGGSDTGHMCGSDRRQVHGGPQLTSGLSPCRTRLFAMFACQAIHRQGARRLRERVRRAASISTRAAFG